MKANEKEKLAAAKARAAEKAAAEKVRKGAKERFRMDTYYQELKDAGKSDKEILKAFTKYYEEKYAESNPERAKDTEFIKWRFETYKAIAEEKAAAEKAKKIFAKNAVKKKAKK